VANGANSRHSTALSEYVALFLNGLQRSVKGARAVAVPENCSIFQIETAIMCGQSPFFVLQFERRACGSEQSVRLELLI
jgi:hypothetical protein